MIKDKRNPEFREGSLIEGFRVKSIDQLSKLNNIMYQLEHEATGALMIHLSNEDDNNCFSVALRTTPTDSTGVAHILEHTALCGSNSFPVRDPFFSMTRRSMKTFMNAMTASDWTMYPFATQNESDFFNLMKVYLDAVFFPLLTELSFKQEGHRLEFVDGNDITSPLTVQGIVYSEMMGAMSSQSHIMHQNVSYALFPTVTYKYNSGGDPAKIINLSHQQLKEFHQFHYHPSNSLFYTYGNIPLIKHLTEINSSVLSKFDKVTIDTSVPNEQRFTSPLEFSFHYPLNRSEDDGEKCQIALAWLTCSIENPLQVLSLQVINLILLGHSGAPLRKQLLESKLGKSLADTTGFEDEIKEPYFSVGLQAVAQKNISQVEELIMMTLKEIVEQGIKPEQIESAIHQMELSTKEISGGHYPYSLNLLFRFFGTWTHGGDPVKSIDFDQTLEELKKKMQEGPFLENQIRKYLIDNPHRVKVVLLPDPDLEKETNAKLEKHLAKTKSELSASEKKKLVLTANQLKKYQEEDEDLTCLPTLTISDIPRGLKYVEPYQQGRGDLDITFYDQPTNGIAYLSWHFRIDNISEEEREWLPVLGYLLTGTGAGGLSYEEMAEQTSRYTGGFSASPSIEVNFNNKDGFQDFFSVSSKALNQNLKKMFELGEKIIRQWDLNDFKRIQTLIALRTNHLINSIVSIGHNYASSLANRQFSRVNQIEEIYGGIHQIRFMKRLVGMTDQKLEEAIENLNQLTERLFCKDGLSMLLIGEKDMFDEAGSLISDFCANLPSSRHTHFNKSFQEGDAPQAQEFQTGYQNEAWFTTTPVSYVAQSFKTNSFTHKDSPKLLVLSSLLKSLFLHGELREKGGAYGGMANYSMDEGIFSMLSYRDPHLARTISVYQRALAWLQEGKFTQQDVEENIIQTCSGMDTPLSPAGKAVVDYINDRKGKTKELREQFRAGVLQCTKDDLIRVGNLYLETQPSLAAITSEEISKRDEAALTDHPLDKHNI